MRAPVTIYTDLGLSSIHLHLSGAFRLWTLARSLDSNGGGRIRHSDLDELAAACHVKRRTFFYWLAQAQKAGFFQDSRPGIIRPLSLLKVAQLLKVDKLNRRVSMSPARLYGKSWRAYIFASTHNGKPTSRQTLKQLTGISQRTQARYDKRAKTKCKKTIYVTERPASQLETVKEHSPEATAFVFYDKKNRRRVVAHRRPDARTPYGNPEIIRTKWKVNVLLNSANTCNNSFFGRRDNGTRRLFHQSREIAERAAKQNGKNDLNISAFYPVKDTRKAVFYRCI